MSANYLKLNVDGTQVVVCGHEINQGVYSTRLDKFEQLSGTEGKKLKSGKTLVAKIDQNLNFKAMIADICKSGQYRLDKLFNIQV